MATRVRIRGMVQGVGYRAAFAREAQRRGLCGWVRNRTDGSVEALLDGDDSAVQGLLEWARKGPAAARVDAVLASVEVVAVGDDFQIAPTA